MRNEIKLVLVLLGLSAFGCDLWATSCIQRSAVREHVGSQGRNHCEDRRGDSCSCRDDDGRTYAGNITRAEFDWRAPTYAYCHTTCAAPKEVTVCSGCKIQCYQTRFTDKGRDAACEPAPAGPSAILATFLLPGSSSSPICEIATMQRKRNICLGCFTVSCDGEKSIASSNNE